MSAVFSPCRTWRYTLTRHLRWSCTRDGVTEPCGNCDGCRYMAGVARTVAFVGLNPSTADETQDDPTVRRCIGFARSWGFERMVMLNLFALRSTDPRALRKHPDPVGPLNDEWLIEETRKADMVVCAWGTNGAFIPQGKHAAMLRCDFMHLRLASLVPEKLRVLGLTKGGHPKHPLYLRADTEPVPWTA